MTIGGWIALVFSVGGATLLFAWSLYLVLTRKEQGAEDSQEEAGKKSKQRIARRKRVKKQVEDSKKRKQAKK